jgi:hypothetical protein
MSSPPLGWDDVGYSLTDRARMMLHEPLRDDAARSRVADRRQLGGWLPEAAGYALSAVLSLLAAAWVLALQRGSLTEAWYYSGDALFYASVSKGILDHGWYLDNPELGAPRGQNMADFPLINSDFTQVLLLKLIDLFVDGPFTTVNLFLLLTFPLVAISAFWAMRHLGVSFWVAVVVSVLFAVLPYHFVRNVHHLSLSSYYTVPLVCALVLDVVAGRPLLTARAGPGRVTRWVTPTSVRTVLVCLLIGATSAYYAIFALALLASAAFLRALSMRSWRPLLAGGVTVALVLGTLTVVQLPTLAKYAEQGKNALVAHRDPFDSETYALKLAQMVFPISDHRVDALARFSNRYEATTPVPSEIGGNLGLVATVGLGWLLLVVLVSLVSHGRRFGTEEERHAGVMTLIAFIFATVGGLSAVIAFAVTAQVRGWNRMSVVIAFFALLSAGYLLDRLGRRLVLRRARVAFLIGLIAVLWVGLLDQTGPRYAPAHAEASHQQEIVEAFVTEAQIMLPEGGAMLQLPYVSFPENGPINGMGDYEHLRPYLSSTSLRYSYGAVKGSPEDWHGPLSGAPLPLLLDVGAALGFDAVYVDRNAFTDRAQELMSALDTELGRAILRSRDDRLVLWDLRAREGQLVSRLTPAQLEELREVGTRPVRGFLVDGFRRVGMLTGSISRDAEPEAAVRLQNQRDETVQVVLQVGLATAGNGATAVRLAFPDKSTRDVALGSEPKMLTHVFDVPPGDSEIRLTSTGYPAFDPRMRTPLVTTLMNPVLVPLDACLGRAGGSEPTVASCTAGAHPQVP